MKRIVAIVALLLVPVTLLPSSSLAGLKEEGIRLFAEAEKLKNNARSNEDLRKAAEKYAQALNTLERAKFDKAVAAVSNDLGTVYDTLGQYEKAIEYYEKSLRLKQKLGNIKGQASTLYNLGRVYKILGQHQKSAEYYEKDLAILRKLGDVKGEGEVLNDLGGVYKALSRHEKAAEYYGENLVIRKKLKDLKGEMEALNNLGIAYWELSQYEKAGEHLRRALEIARNLNDSRSEASALGNLAIVHKDLGQYGKAIECDEKGLEIYRKLGDRKGEMTSLNNLGTASSDLGQYKKAADYHEKALEIARQLKDPKAEANAYGNLGVVNFYWGQYQKAVEYHQKDLEIRRKLGNVKGEVATLNNLGNVFYVWGRYQKAVECYDKALDLSRKIAYPKGERLTLSNLAGAFRNWGWYDKAVEYYEKSLDLSKKQGDPKSQGHVLMNLGVVYDYRGETGKALKNYEKGLELYTQMGVPTRWPKDLIGNAYLNLGDFQRAERFITEAGFNDSLGRLSLAKSEHEKAKMFYERLLSSAEKTRSANDLLAANTGLGLAFEGMDDNAAAAKYFRKAVDYTEHLRSTLDPKQRETFFSVKAPGSGFHRTAPYEGLARVLVKLNRPLEAFKDSEFTRARIFAEAMSRRSESGGLDVPQEVRDRDFHLTDKLAGLTKNLQQAHEKGNEEVIASLEPQVRQAEQDLAVHVDMLRKHYPLFAATRYPQPMDLDKTALQDNEWVLAYHVTDPGLVVYLTKGKNLVKALFKPIPRKQLDSLVRGFREPLEMKQGDNFVDKLRSFDFATGKKLSDILLGDILPLLPKDSPLIIIPDDCLGVLPFEMLPLNDGGRIVTDKRIPYASGAEFFGDRNPISYYQSVTALTLARIYGRGKKGPGDKLLVFADPVFEMRDARAQASGTAQRVASAGAGQYVELMAAMEEGAVSGLRFARLAGTSTLGENLAKLYPNSDSYTGIEASKDRFLKQVAPSLAAYDKIVFATHGYFGKDLPGIMEPVLVLTLVPPGTDGYLRMSEVAGLKMNADMVALTACQTGLGKKLAGEGTMGMGRAFQYAGARSVLMSLWSVGEKASVDLVEGLFTHQKEGKGRLEALKMARDRIRSQGFDHPFFWASFILVGEVE